MVRICADVEHVEWLCAQQQAQNEVDQRTMAAEFDARQKEVGDE